MFYNTIAERAVDLKDIVKLIVVGRRMIRSYQCFLILALEWAVCLYKKKIVFLYTASWITTWCILLVYILNVSYGAEKICSFSSTIAKFFFARIMLVQ